MKLKLAESGNTVITRSESGKTFKQVRSAWSREWESEDAPTQLKAPYQSVLVGDLLGAIEEHDIEPLINSGAGQNIGYFDEVRTVKVAIYDLLKEASEVLGLQASFLK